MRGVKLCLGFYDTRDGRPKTRVGNRVKRRHLFAEEPQKISILDGHQPRIARPEPRADARSSPVYVRCPTRTESSRVARRLDLASGAFRVTSAVNPRPSVFTTSRMSRVSYAASFILRRRASRRWTRRRSGLTGFDGYLPQGILLNFTKYGCFTIW